jgi:hypothetical protein
MSTVQPFATLVVECGLHGGELGPRAPEPQASPLAGASLADAVTEPPKADDAPGAPEGQGEAAA